MPRNTPAPSLVDAVGARLASGWSVPVLGVVMPALGAVLATLGQDHQSASDWWLLGGGTVTAIIGGLGLWIREVAGNRSDIANATEADRLRVLVKDALQPVAELIAQMPAMTPGKRQDRLREVAQQAVGALRLLLKDVDRLRAVIYAVAPSGMVCMAYQGRGNTPRPFVQTTERGRLALEMVRSGGSLFVEDIADRPPAYQGTGSDYQTFISASIANGSEAYGMVTVDAPTAGDLVETDQQIVMLVADLLSIAFAIAA